MAAPRVAFDADDHRRYGRHFVLPEVGADGQARLATSSVLLVGAGGLGSPAALYLAAAGVGRLGLVDFDAVDLSNLQRQVLYGTRDVGRPKLDAACERLADLNPGIRIEPHRTRLDPSNALSLIRDYDAVLDGSDNFPTRYLVNDACAFAGKPDVFGSVFRFEGQVSVFHAGRGPCYRCLYPEPPAPGSVPNCAEGGVLGVLPGIVGAIQAVEAIKILLGKGTTLLGRLLLFDALAMRFDELRIARDPGCPLCGDRPSIRDLEEAAATCAIPVTTPAPTGTGAASLKRRLDAGEPLLLLDVRTEGEFALARIPGARLIPVHELGARSHELDPATPVVVYCHRGIRSLQGVEILRRAGFSRVEHLDGGIDAWATEVDPEMPRY